jgi:hypothetical protein
LDNLSFGLPSSPIEETPSGVEVKLERPQRSEDERA